jgi:thymidylate kinase
MAKIARLLVTFSGVDGSGKSTLAQALIEQLSSKGVKTEYLWWFSANDSFIGKIAESVVQKLAKPAENNTDGFPKVGLVRALYQSLVLVDFLLHVWSSSILRENLVCDRYVYDIVVFFATELNYSESKAKNLIRLLKSVTPKPLIAFLVDVPAEIAMQRKNDIPSSEQHERLRGLYFDLVKGDATVKLVDGSKRLEEVNHIVWAQVNNRLRESRGAYKLSA